MSFKIKVNQETGEITIEQKDKTPVSHLDSIVMTDAQRKKLDAILSAVSYVRGIQKGFILGRAKPVAIAEARALAMYMARAHTDLSYPQLGFVFQRHHSTVIDAYEKVKIRLTSPKWAESIQNDIDAILAYVEKSGR